MPYNYLLDEKIRENFNLEYDNAIIIFDEGHNIQQCAEDVASFDVKSKHLEQTIEELHSL
jgi:Rad3-related DNA helicase